MSKPNAAERRYHQRVRELGCCICGSEANAHHVSSGGMGMKSSHYDVIPLCHIHHQNGGHGVAIHAGKTSWESRHGAELAHLALTKKVLNVQD